MNSIAQNGVISLLDLLRADGSIVVNKALAHAIGLNEAIVYSELVSLNEYWRKHEKLTDGEWFFCTVENLEKNTTIKQKTQQRTIKNLENLGLIETRRRGLPAKRYFKITDGIYNLIRQEPLHNQSGHIDQSSEVNLSNTERSKTPGNNTRTNNPNLFNKNIYTRTREENDITPEEIEKRRELARFNWLEGNHG